MSLDNTQAGWIWDQVYLHRRYGNQMAHDLWAAWHASPYGDAYDFIRHELTKPDCLPYLAQIVCESVEYRIIR